MSRRKGVPEEILKRNIQELEDFCCANDLERELKQFSPYHFRLLGKIDIWPGRKILYIQGRNHSENYWDINDLKKYVNKSN